MTSVPEQDEQLTKIYIDLPNHWWLKGESFWAKSLGDDLFEIQNVPFCAYGLNFGDVVKAIQQSPDLKPEIIEVVRKSGNQTLRVHFMVDRDQQQTHINNIEARQAWVERANAKFMSFGTFSTYIQPKQVYGLTTAARLSGMMMDIDRMEWQWQVSAKDNVLDGLRVILAS